MAPRLRVGIVGAGIVGCAAAFELARRGADVTVFDMRSPGAGATQASAGILAPFIEGHEQGEFLDLAVRGLNLYDDFVENVRGATGSGDFEYRRTGTLEIADSPERAAILTQRAERLRERAPIEWVDQQQLRALEPATDPRHAGALLCSVHGFVAVMPFVAALISAARACGARFHSAMAVREIEIEPGSCILWTDDRHQFDRILLSTGSWASSLDPCDEIRDTVRPIKGQLVALGWTGPRVQHVLWGSDCYIVPWQDSTLFVGATSEDVGFDERPTAEGVRGLLASAMTLLPKARDAAFQGVRVGLRPATAEGFPLLGPSARDPRIFYALGHFRNGVLLAPLTATVAAAYFLLGQQDPAFRRANGA